jgi:uncharacterized phage protein gp47/JayE
MAASGDVYQYVEPDGVIIPDTEVIQTQVIAEYKALFGQDFIVTANTAQGLLISAETQSRDGIAVNNATVANQINPNIAGGIFLDAIAALTGIQRTVATYSTVVGTVTGVAGTIIPAGSQAKETVGQQVFQTVSMITIPIGGSIDVTFQAVNAGPIAVSPGTLTQIVSVVLGWETVTNSAAGTLGTETQSDDALRLYRRNTLAIQGEGLAEAILSGLYATPNVHSATFRENFLTTTEVIDGVTMNPNSIYACVDGGTDSDIAATLVAKKNGGCQYTNGAGISVSVSYTEPFSGQVMTILFDRPTPVPVKIRVTIRVQDTLSDPLTAVQNAILNYAAGLIPGEPGFTVGTSVSPFEIAGAINYYSRSIFVTLVEVSLQTPVSYSTNTLPIAIFEIATIAVSDITVIIL